MTENINILAGAKPVRTGNLRRDFEALDDWTTRLLRGLERGFEEVGRTERTLEKRITDLEKQLREIREETDNE